MRDNNTSNGRTGENAWCVSVVSAVLVLAVALGLMAGIRSFFFFLSHLTGTFSFMGSGLLLLVTLSNITPVFLMAISWLWSFRSGGPSRRKT